MLSLGSNLGDRLAHLRAVVAALRPTARGQLRCTRPRRGGRSSSTTTSTRSSSSDDPAPTPHGWLARAHELEQAAGRTREVRWGPRTLDVDVIAVDDAARSADDPELTLPHPRAHERAFVLVPWADVDPDAVLPGHGRVADLVDLVADRSGVRRTDLELR